jgi:signal transduction histidine kinase
MSTEQVRSAVKHLASVLLDDVEWIAECSVARMQGLLPSYAKVPAERLIPVTLANTRNLLEAVRDSDADPTRREDHVRMSGETRVSREIAADEMLQAWRIGLEVVREQARAAAIRLGIADGALLDFVEATLQWGDIGMRNSASAYRETEIRELERLAAEQAALRRVATLVARESPPSEVFAKVADEVADVFGGVEASMFKNEGDGTATIVALSGIDMPLGTRLPTDGNGVIANVLREARPIWMDGNSVKTGAIAARGDELGIRSAIGCPIVVRGRVWGALGAARHDREPFPPGTETQLGRFAELVATAVANAEARGEVARLAEEQAALRRVAMLVASGGSPAEVFDAVAAEIAAPLNADGITLCRYEPDDELTILAHRGPAARQVPPGTRIRHDGDSVSATVRRTQCPARMASYAETRGQIGQVIKSLTFRSGVGAPIVVDGRLWGVTIANWIGAEPPPPDTEERMAKFAELLDTAIANADSRGQLTASRARLVTEADEARRRVVRDLHDGAQQRLVHAIVTLKLAQQALAANDDAAGSLIAEALQHAQQGNAELRELAHGLLPNVLTRGGLHAGLNLIVSRVNLPVELDISAARFPPEIEASAYFVVAEALTNVVKHSHAERAQVRVCMEDGMLRVEVGDDGIGGADPSGHGLVGLSDRVTAIGGALVVETPENGGTLLVAKLPVSAS